jgi:hypothetical protein
VCPVQGTITALALECPVQVYPSLLRTIYNHLPVVLLSTQPGVDLIRLAIVPNRSNKPDLTLFLHLDIFE